MPLSTTTLTHLPGLPISLHRRLGSEAPGKEVCESHLVPDAASTGQSRTKVMYAWLSAGSLGVIIPGARRVRAYSPAQCTTSPYSVGTSRDKTSVNYGAITVNHFVTFSFDCFAFNLADESSENMVQRGGCGDFGNL